LEIGHVLFIDIVGYSQLLITQQSEQVETLRRIVRGTAQFRAAEAEGKLIRLPTGDGGALVFRTTPEAPVLCALEIAKELKNHPVLRVRMGIHSGPVNAVTDLNEQANIAGAGINVAQRVMNCGDAGHILLSKHVAEDLEQYPRWRPQLHDLGDCEVKHGARIGVVNLYTDEVGKPQLPKKFQALKKHRVRVRWAALAVALIVLAAIIAGLLFFLRRPMRSPSPIWEKSIAVLPFENRSEDKANAYFADGIQDEILTLLSKIADLKVISRTSTQQYQGEPRNLTEIAKQLGVANILEGSVQKAADQVRVNVQLVNAQTDSHLWANTYDRKLTDIFAVESEIAKAIAMSLQAKLTGREEQALAVKPTSNPEAYDAYLRGLAFATRSSLSHSNDLLGKASRFFERAVQIDPNFALAWARLSRADAQLYFDTASAASRDAAKSALENAQKLEPNSAETLLALGYYQYHVLSDYGSAKTTFNRVSKLLPSSSEAPTALGSIARRGGNWDQSIAYFEQALALDPRNVESLIHAAQTYATLRQFPAALKLYDRVLDITPNDPDAMASKAGIYQAQGNLQEAAKLLEKENKGQDSGAKLTQLRLERNYGETVRLVQDQLARSHYDSQVNKAGVQAWLALMQRLAGDTAGAKVTAEQARNTLEQSHGDQPDIQYLGLSEAYAVTGQKDLALKAAERAVSLYPRAKDPMVGPVYEENLALIQTLVGENSSAISTLTQLLETPYWGGFYTPVPITPAILRLDPLWDPLRADPAFQKLCQGN
jgi:TolB-like protein/Flp pilus assembly protein TadD